WGRLTAWDVDGTRRWSVEGVHDGWVRDVALSPDTAVVATCGRDGYVRLWAAATGKRDIEWNVGADVFCLAVNRERLTLVAGDLFGMVREFHYASGKPGRTFEATELYKLDRIQDVGGVRCLLFDPEGKTLFVAGAIPSTGGFVQCTPLVIAFDFA